MDGRRFDELVRTFAAHASRRSVLKGLLASAAGALGAHSGSARAQACRPAGRLCSVNSQCCSGLCDTTNADPAQRHRCACPPGTENCRGACKDPLTAYRADPSNCGGCDRFCPVPYNAATTCADGACGYACLPGFADCNGAFEDGCETVPATDPNHCGACDAPCSTTNMAIVVCAGGSCESGECAAGFADCNGDKRTDGCETDILNDLLNCGTCGHSCPDRPNTTKSCVGGVCTYTCNAGFASCDGSPSEADANGCEVNTQIDANHCGGCGNNCSSNHVATPTCAGGVCTGACDAGWADCDGDKLTNGCETDIATGPDNCGDCDIVCSANNMATRTCAGGACTGECAAGFADCNGNKQSDGCEVNTQTDPNHCGGCNAACSNNNIATRTCAGGACTGACATGFADCNNDKRTDGCETNIASLPDNCGGCGVTCSSNNMATRTCSGGICNGTCAAGFADCDGNKQSNGCEVNTQTDVNHCGGCGQSCEASKPANTVVGSCTNGVCSYACAFGFADCGGTGDGCETNTQTNTAHCGACGHACVAGEVCVNGACRCGSGPACDPLEVCTDGVCICDGDICATGETCTLFETTVGGLVIRLINCACGAGLPCFQTGVCVDGSCRCGDGPGCRDVEECAAGRCCPICKPGETNDANCMCHCGTGPVCGVSATCVDGACRCGAGPACTGGQHCCGGTCVNPATDINNCGRCGSVCLPGETCEGGLCRCGGGAGCRSQETCVSGACKCGTGPGCSGFDICCVGTCIECLCCVPSSCSGSPAPSCSETTCLNGTCTACGTGRCGPGGCICPPGQLRPPGG
jgi:hypothetical protein